VLFAKYYSGDKMEEDKMGGTCDRYGRKSKLTNTFSGNLKVKNYLVHPTLDWRMILTNQNEM